MHRHARSLLSISLVLFFALFLTLSVSPIPLGNQNGGKAIADPGSGWEEHIPEDVSSVFNVSPVDSSIAWIAGRDGSNWVAYRTEDGGQTWVRKYETPTSSGGLICRVFAIDENAAWICGAEVGGQFMGFIDATSDGGATWSRVYSRQYRMPLKLIALDDSNLWMLGVEVYWLPDITTGMNNVYSVGFIERTSDAGLNWVRQYSYLFYQTNNPKYLIPYPAFPYLFDLEVVDSSTAWAIIYDRAIKTENWGWTWDIQLSGGPFLTSNVTAVDSQKAWVTQGREIRKTLDGGASWETQYTAEPGQAIRDIVAIDDNVAWALLHDTSSSTAYPYPIFLNGRHLKTIDGGASWLQQETPGTYSLMNIEAFDAATAWTAGGEGVVLKTTDGGDPRPDIISISPPSGAMDAEVTITGCDFGDNQDSSLVFFGAVQAIEYTSWSDTQIAVKVPAEVTGTVQVTVTTPEGISNGKPFTVSSPIIPPCGEGSGTALLMLGLTLGLLSLAGTAGRKKRRT